MTHPIKQLFVMLLSIVCLLFSCLSHADFNKALNAYINNQPQILMTEVRESVSRSDTKGLILFINGLDHDHLRSSAVNLDFRQRPKARYKTKISTILSTKEHAELKRLLWKIAKKCSTDAQYLLHHIYEFSSFDHQFLLEARAQAQENPTKENEAHLSKAFQQYKKLHLQEIEKLANQGNRYAALDMYHENISVDNPDLEKAKYWLIRAAELNHPLAIAELSLKYLHGKSNIFSANTFCENKSKYRVCLKKNIKKGEELLKRATKQYLNDPAGPLNGFGIEIGKYLEERKGAKESDIKQAFFWYLKELQSAEYYYSHDAYLQIEKLYQQGYLAHIAPDLNQVWNDRKAKELWLKSPENYTQPQLINTLSSEIGRQPIFSLEFSDFSSGELNVYRNGDVFYTMAGGGYANTFKGKRTTVSEDKVAEFLKKLADVGFDSWYLSSQLAATRSAECVIFKHGLCRTDFYIATLREGNFKKAIQFMIHDERFERMLALVESYFPTQKFRCELSGSQAYRVACNEYYKKIVEANSK